MEFFFNSQFILFKLSDSVIRRKVESVIVMFIFLTKALPWKRWPSCICCAFLGNKISL